MPWWQDRDIKDLPQYVKLEINKKIHFVHKVEAWIGNNSLHQPLYNYFNKAKYLSTFCVDGELPATLEEYTHYINTNKQAY